MKKPFLIAAIWTLAIPLFVHSQSKQVYTQGGSRTDCEVLTDKYGRIVTRCISFRSNNTTLETITLGTNYYNNVVWQQGKVDLDGNGKEQPCWISYSLNPTEIVIYFDDVNKQVPVTPYAFTIGNKRLVSYSEKLVGKAYRKYFELVYVGKVNLLKYHSIAIDAPPFELKKYYTNWFRPVETYFIQREGEAPVEIQLTEHSLYKTLARETGKPVKSTAGSRKKLTVAEIIALLQKQDNAEN